MFAPRSIELQQPGLFRIIYGRFESIGIKHDNILFRRSSVLIFLGKSGS